MVNAYCGVKFQLARYDINPETIDCFHSPPVATNLEINIFGREVVAIYSKFNQSTEPLIEILKLVNLDEDCFVYPTEKQKSALRKAVRKAKRKLEYSSSSSSDYSF